MCFSKNHESGRLVPDLLLFLKKALYEVKANGLVSINFDNLKLGIQ